MHKINPQSLASQSLFGLPLDKIIPKDHPKRVILDKLSWDELVKIAKRAYISDYWKDKPNARIMIGLFVWHCLSGDKTYREIADDFSFHILCAYSCGFKEIESRTIDNSTLIKFEEHLGEENILAIKDIIERASVKKQAPNSKGRHSGDSTVFEANITYPTDTKIMESVRVFLVNDIIKQYQNRVNQKHRTYTRVARAAYLSFAKKRNATKKEIKKIKKTQLQFLKRNIGQAGKVIATIEEKIANKEIKPDGKTNKQAFKKLKAKLNLAKIIYNQQYALYQGEKIEDRIVSFHRPNVRPIFRGKAQKKTEFGPKVAFSLMGKALIMGKLSYNNFYDGKGMKQSIDKIRNRGYPMKEMIGDKGNGGLCSFLKNLNITDGIEKRGKRIKPPPIPKKRFGRARNRIEGAQGCLKNVFIKNGLRAKTDFGDLKKICKAVIGFNLTYAL